MTSFVVTVDFKLKPGAMDAFRRLMDRNAMESCRFEAGCRRFDVLVPERETDRVFLYEIYDSRAAFDTHLKTAHFDAFNRESVDLVLSKDIRILTLVCEASAKEAVA